jgi:REP element-mobilizing transposase RayT
MIKFKGIYRPESTRLKGWDYSSAGYYFITICTKNREPFFGEVKGDEMHLNPMGEIAKIYWLEIPIHFTNTTLDEFIVMPNHVHGIVVIQDASVETQHVASLQQQMQKPHIHREFGPLQPGSLSTIIRSYKSAVTRWARKNGYDDFSWQSRFYDHIIRDETSLQSICQYICDNPLKWAQDENNPEILNGK